MHQSYVVIAANPSIRQIVPINFFVIHFQTNKMSDVSSFLSLNLNVVLTLLSQHWVTVDPELDVVPNVYDLYVQRTCNEIQTVLCVGSAHNVKNMFRKFYIFETNSFPPRIITSCTKS